MVHGGMIVNELHPLQYYTTNTNYIPAHAIANGWHTFLMDYTHACALQYATCIQTQTEYTCM